MNKTVVGRSARNALVFFLLLFFPPTSFAETGYRAGIELPGFLWAYGRTLYATKDEGCLKGFDEIRPYLGYSFKDRLCASIAPPGGAHCAFGLPEGGCAGIGGFSSSAITCSDTSINSLGGLSNVAPTSRYTCPTNGATINVAKAVGVPPAGTCVGNPCNVATGNKFQTETDYVGAGGFPLLIRRFYNSDPTRPGSIGRGWRHHYERSLVLLLRPNDNFIRAVRPDGKELAFRQVGTNWLGDADVNDRLEPLSDGTGWRYVTSEDAVERYDTAGRLLSITDRAGLAHTLAYDTQGRIAAVSDPFGRQLTFSYDTRNRASTLTDPAGGVFRYSYDASGNLASVTFPDDALRTYRYENSSLPNALTGIDDENGNRFATYSYDAQGRATSTEHAGGANRASFAYNPDGTTTVTDALGVARAYTFQTALGVPRATTIAGPPCPNCGFNIVTLDANGNVASRRDFNGNLTCYSYDLARNLETKRVEALSGSTCPGTPIAGVTRTITTEWDQTFRLPRRIAEPKRVTTYVYDTRGNPTSKSIQATTDATGASGFSAAQSGTARAWTNAHTYSTTIPGLVTRKVIDGPRTDVADTTIYRYNESGNLTAVTNALGHVTTLGNYDAHGRPRKITDPNGLTTTLAYDKPGRLRAKTTGGETTTYHYDRAGQLKHLTLPDGSHLWYTYDAAQRLTGIRDALGNRIAYLLDAMGNRTREEVFDGSGRLVHTRSRAFDASNRLAQDLGAAGQITRYGHDAEGNLTSVTDPLGRVVAHSFDALNRLARVTDAANGVIDFTYGLGELTSVTDPRRLTTTYQSYGLGERTAESSPDSGSTRLTYDAGGNVQARTDARGEKTTFHYDALNRMTRAQFADGAQIRYAYDQGPNALGRLTAMVQEGGYPLLQWTYNARGKLETETFTDLPSPGSPPLTLRQGYRYDAAVRLRERIYPSGQKVSYTYDGSGRVASIAYDGTPVLQAIAYQPFGDTAGWIWGNGTRHERRFDRDGRIVSYPLGGHLRHLSYDAASRITDITHTAVESSGLPRRVSRDHAALDQHFEYDRLDRLMRAVGSRESRVYRYDANGNRLGLSLNGEGSVYSVAANSNHLVAVAGRSVRDFRYDAAGNTLSDDVANLRYNAQGRMASATVGKITTTYLYNGKGERVAKKGRHVRGGAIYFAYDEAGQLIGEYDARATPIQEILYLGPLPVAVVRNDVLYYIHADHLGTPRAITDTANKVVWRWDSEPFGTTAPEGDGNRFVFNLRFPGQYYDQETGLHYNYYRDYDPNTGRYLESDPIGLAGGLNTYSYADGNPVSYADPTGEIPIIPIAIGVALATGSQSTSFQNAAASAAQYWANQQVETGNWLYGIPGGLATLADPCNVGTTATVLGVGSLAGAYLGRPFWQYYPAGNPGYASPWITRGWGWNPPHQPGTQAAQQLGLPPWNPGTAVRSVVPAPTQFIGGASRVGPYANPLYPGYAQPGGGIQYTVGRWPAGTSNWIPWAF